MHNRIEVPRRLWIPLGVSLMLGGVVMALIALTFLFGGQIFLMTKTPENGLYIVAFMGAIALLGFVMGLLALVTGVTSRKP
jgi:hypothetical protein